MLKIDNVRRIENVTVYGDDNNPFRFYLLPDTPGFRRNDNGTLAFTFLKYRMPLTREDGRVGGGFLVFDSELSVPKEREEAIRAKLQEEINAKFAGRNPMPQVEFGSITWMKGTAAINLENGFNGFVEKVHNPGKPSLYGRLLTPFTVELTPEGASLLEQALTGKGGFVQVTYDLWALVKLPPIHARVWFNAHNFYSFTQNWSKDVHVESIFGDICDWLFGGDDEDTVTITQTVSEVASKGQWGGVEIKFETELPDPKMNADMQEKVRAWAFDTLRQAMKDMMADPTKPLTEEQRKIPEDVTDFHQTVSQFNFSSFNMEFNEEHAVLMNLAPQGMLEPITNMKDGEGNPIKWEDYARTIDLNDPFFQRIDVAVRANADFKNLPIDSIVVSLSYQEGTVNEAATFSLTTPDTIEHFKTFIEGGKREYGYRYQVNYKGESRNFDSGPKTTKDTFLTINVGDTGILAVDVQPGDINFTQVTQALVTLNYTGGAEGPVERQFILTKDKPVHSIREVVFKPVTEPYNYTVKYIMNDGREFTGPVSSSRSQQLVINAVFSAMKTVGVRAAGNLDTDINMIFVDLRYVDEANDYIKTSSVALSKATPFFDWAFPVINGKGGAVFYGGSIQYRDGRVEDIPEQQAERDTFMVGALVEDVVQVKVLPNLVDFTKAQLVQVSLHYTDADNDIDERTDLIFDPSAKVPQTWNLPLKDKTRTAYSWVATYFMADGSTREERKENTSQLSIVLRIPAA